MAEKCSGRMDHDTPIVNKRRIMKPLLSCAEIRQKKLSAVHGLAFAYHTASSLPHSSCE
jgi:hypothetical protein